MKSMENSLILALKSKDVNKLQEVFEMIYNEYVKLIAFYISKYIVDDEVVKDITNDVFVAFFDNCHNVKSSIKYYLLVICKNKINDYLKNDKCIVLIDEVDTIVAPINNSGMYYEYINDLSSVLNEKEVNIIIMHAVNGLTFKQIGSELNINHKNANKIYERAIKKYKKTRCL